MSDPRGYLPGKMSVGEAQAARFKDLDGTDGPFIEPSIGREKELQSILDGIQSPPPDVDTPSNGVSLLDGPDKGAWSKIRELATSILEYMPSIMSEAEAADKMTISEKEDLIRGVFGDEGDLAVAIAKAESFPDLKEEAEGPKGEDSWGIFQINWDIWGPDAVSKKDGSVGVGYKKVNRQLKSFLGRDWEKDDLKNPEANVRAAKIIRDLKGWGGWDQWMGYTKGGYKKFYNP